MSTFRHADERWIRIRSYGVTFHANPESTPHHLAPPYARDWHQLIYAVRGVIRVRTQEHLWILPPHRALWIPCGVGSKLDMHGEVALRMLYVRAGPRGLAKACTVANVTPLLRELILRANNMGALEDRKPEQARLIAVIVDELRALHAVPLQLPLPRDERAMRFAELASESPQAGPPPERFVRQSGASRRTLERLFLEETALNLGQWRRRQVLLHAVALLGDGNSVRTVAEKLGYNSASAFIAMFRKELGATPAKYLAEL